VTPDPAEHFTFNISAPPADTNAVQDVINRATATFARGGLVRQRPGAVA